MVLNSSTSLFRGHRCRRPNIHPLYLSDLRGFEPDVVVEACVTAGGFEAAKVVWLEIISEASQRLDRLKVSPTAKVAILAAYRDECRPYFAGRLSNMRDWMEG